MQSHTSNFCITRISHAASRRVTRCSSGQQWMWQRADYYGWGRPLVLLKSRMFLMDLWPLKRWSKAKGMKQKTTISRATYVWCAKFPSLPDKTIVDFPHFWALSKRLSLVLLRLPYSLHDRRWRRGEVGSERLGTSPAKASRIWKAGLQGGVLGFEGGKVKLKNHSNQSIIGLLMAGVFETLCTKATANATRERSSACAWTSVRDVGSPLGDVRRRKLDEPSIRPNEKRSWSFSFSNESVSHVSPKWVISPAFSFPW